MIRITHKGNFNDTKVYLEHAAECSNPKKLNEYAMKGLAALIAATPVDSGKTAASWSYEIQRQPGSVSIVYRNSNINKNVPIAIILQYGHGTRNGGWVQGRDYINPALQPIFDELAEKTWKEVKRL